VIDLGTKKGRFIERSTLGALSFLKESLFADEYASKSGFLQARDPRIKAVAILALLLSVLVAKSIPFILSIYLLCLFFASVSSIDLWYFLKRTWLFIPIFALLIALPALFNVFSPGEPLLSFRIADFNLSITRQGVAGAAIFFARVLTSVSLCVLLTLTTRHNTLLKVLRLFGIPQVFVMTMGMCYRYVFLFIEIVQNTYTAIKSRAGRLVSSSKGRRIVAWNIASLWQRSYALHNQVYGAMLSRGYTGEPKVMETFSITAKDMACLGIAVSLLLGSIWQTHYLN
jgi:cobalt/nickel transport system permease protein